MTVHEICVDFIAVLGLTLFYWMIYNYVSYAIKEHLFTTVCTAIYISKFSLNNVPDELPADVKNEVMQKMISFKDIDDLPLFGLKCNQFVVNKEDYETLVRPYLEKIFNCLSFSLFWKLFI